MSENLKAFEYSSHNLSSFEAEAEIMTYCGASNVRSSNIPPVLSVGQTIHGIIFLPNGRVECKIQPYKTNDGYNVKISEIIFTKSRN